MDNFKEKMYLLQLKPTIMKSPLPILVLLAFITALLAFRLQESKIETHSPRNSSDKIRNIALCSPDWTALKDRMEETDIPPIPGAGSYQWKISTESDSAQFYFNQGINMYYGFHIIEAIASSKRHRNWTLVVPCCIGHRHWRMDQI